MSVPRLLAQGFHRISYHQQKAEESSEDDESDGKQDKKQEKRKEVDVETSIKYMKSTGTN